MKHLKFNFLLSYFVTQFLEIGLILKEAKIKRLKRIENVKALIVSWIFNQNLEESLNF